MPPVVRGRGNPFFAGVVHAQATAVAPPSAACAAQRRVRPRGGLPPCHAPTAAAHRGTGSTAAAVDAAAAATSPSAPPPQPLLPPPRRACDCGGGSGGTAAATERRGGGGRPARPPAAAAGRLALPQRGSAERGRGVEAGGECPSPPPHTLTLTPTGHHRVVARGGRGVAGDGGRPWRAFPRTPPRPLGPRGQAPPVGSGPLPRLRLGVGRLGTTGRARVLRPPRQYTPPPRGVLSPPVCRPRAHRHPLTPLHPSTPPPPSPPLPRHARTMSSPIPVGTQLRVSITGPR